MTITISIIGSAGRNGLISNINSNIYNKMITKCKKFITEICEKNKISLNDVNIISGGAALSDHVAISLFLDGFISNLTLYLPTQFDIKNKKFQNNKIGSTSNRYHHQFSKKVGINSLEQISESLLKGVNTFVGNGFFDRNNYISKSTYIIAFSFDGDHISVWDSMEINSPTKSCPLSGGTKYTWDKSTKNGSIRINIPILLI